MMLAEIDDRQMGKLFGCVVFIGAILIYLIGRIVKGIRNGRTDRSEP